MSRRSAKPFSLCNKPRGAVSRDKIVEKIEYYNRRTRNCLGVVESHRLLKIGHQAGDFERYPKNPEKISMHTADISELMKKSFEDYRLDGIEIDIRMDHGNVIDKAVKDIYVVHDKLESPLGPYPTSYLKRNTLRNVLKGFIEAKYHEKNKHIYIEIKCDDSEGLDSRDKAGISGALDVIDEVVKSYPAGKAEAIYRHIALASFNYKALERIDRLCNGQHDLFLIVASNRLVGWLAIKTIYPHFNYLGKRLKKVLSTSEFLKGAWFDPCAVNHFGGIFNGINREREENLLLKPLKVFISTYLLQKEDYFDRLESEREKLRHVEGLFFEMKSHI
jgi:hypothetical protein